MKRFFTTIALVLALSFSFVVLGDAFFCEDQPHSLSSSNHCCIQCCPAHHLFPTPHTVRVIPTPVFTSRFIPQLSLNSALLADSIFHPPKTLLLS